MSRSSRTLYVGNLPGDVREREVEDIFYKYGPIVHIDLKIPPRPPGYAFVEFEESRDAEDAIRGRDGYDFDGHRLRVELAHGGRGNSSSTDRRTESRGPRGGVSRRSDYRVLVTSLPHSASWQDLKDHMRRAGDVCFSQVFHEGSGKTGIVDYTNSDDMKYAVSHIASLPFLIPYETNMHLNDYFLCLFPYLSNSGHTFVPAKFSIDFSSPMQIKKLDGSEFRNAFSRARVHACKHLLMGLISLINLLAASRLKGNHHAAQGLGQDLYLALVLDQKRTLCQDMDICSIWGLHIRILLGKLVQLATTLLGLEWKRLNCLVLSYQLILSECILILLVSLLITCSSAKAVSSLIDLLQDPDPRNQLAWLVNPALEFAVNQEKLQCVMTDGQISKFLVLSEENFLFLQDL
ncbi:hypothetical protein SASPL_122707 [Salvia splendens]|uniref:RRM domain-containing protein n=1 Tax=Salvia splendens TaxID=180675 RepID=A0A8X8ZSQ4_SALSN|nr:hypothetical protein SASPL_122707 [Salvia splendens]